MKFREIASRLTGISSPVFGVSWNPPESDRAIARRVIAYLEDRRVLYVPSEAELPEHCIHSVLEIRRFLTNELGSLPPDGSIAQALSAMRAACRKFLETVQADNGVIVRHGSSHGHYASWVFIGALGELRGVFGVHIAALAAAYGLDIEQQLAAIIPANAVEG
ncbi:hypothetical protein GIY21_19185 [Xanthomonas sontii]|uniref:Uncharacterized protein n=1 Tax=Xanthomonas sontii TaxID=2650745 RepID=A0A6N7QGY3_9XANT|nr:DUF6650 family protein [Xanthomonas sontii]MRH02427.1 hypothetical protein [Xanthomonas sontii]MRH76686.1 hypothetical protein [Xanthomonas sontii]